MATVKERIKGLVGKPVQVWAGHAQHRGVVEQLDDDTATLRPWDYASGGNAYLLCSRTSPVVVVMDAITALKEAGLVVSPTKEAAQNRKSA